MSEQQRQSFSVETTEMTTDVAGDKEPRGFPAAASRNWKK